MKNSRGLTFQVGSLVRFQMPIDNQVDTGVIKYIDGEYIDIEFKIGNNKHICERYPEEIIEVLS
jgi:hypothetical protein